MSDPLDSTDDTGPDEPVGSVGDEAAKLLGALSDWAQDHGSELGQSLSGLAGQAASSLKDVNEHIATGSAECTVCPICRTVHAVRQTSPEVRAHLMTAASALVQAAAGILATQVPSDEPAGGANARGKEVERIDLDSDFPGDNTDNENGPS